MNNDRTQNLSKKNIDSILVQNSQIRKKEIKQQSINKVIELKFKFKRGKEFFFF